VAKLNPARATGGAESALRHNGHSELAEAMVVLAASNRPVVAVMLAEDSAPATVPEGYLKLHLLSHRLVKPHGTDLTGIFGVLKNIAWTSAGAIDIEELPERQLGSAHGRPTAYCQSTVSISFPKWSTMWCPPAFALPIPHEFDWAPMWAKAPQ